MTSHGSVRCQGTPAPNFIFINIVGYVLYSLHVCVWVHQIRQLCLFFFWVVADFSIFSGSVN
jgi:hypothetical protein